jgi:hypothetical protein
LSQGLSTTTFLRQEPAFLTSVFDLLATIGVVLKVNPVPQHTFNGARHSVMVESNLVAGGDRIATKWSPPPRSIPSVLFLEHSLANLPMAVAEASMLRRLVNHAGPVESLHHLARH